MVSLKAATGVSMVITMKKRNTEQTRSDHCCVDGQSFLDLSATTDFGGHTRAAERPVSNRPGCNGYVSPNAKQRDVNRPETKRSKAMMIFRKRFAIVPVLLTLVSLVGGIPTDVAARGKNAKEPYVAQVRWTSFGIPHVRARNWGGLGYGYGYAFARDNVCTLARDVVESTGQLSRLFGPGDGNLQSDLVWVAVRPGMALTTI